MILEVAATQAATGLKPENWIAIGSACVTFILTALGLLLTPKWAVRRSLEQFRSQKWWERQGEEYHLALENLAIIKHCHETNLEHELHPTYAFAASPQVEDQMGTAELELEKIAAMGPYYLSEAASKSLEKCVVSWSIDTGSAPVDELQRVLRAVTECMNIIRAEAIKSLELTPKH